MPGGNIPEATGIELEGRSFQPIPWSQRAASLHIPFTAGNLLINVHHASVS
jgi:hypothetical protein